LGSMFKNQQKSTKCGHGICESEASGRKNA